MKKLLTAALLTLGVPAFAQDTKSISELGCNTVTSPVEIQEVYNWAAAYTGTASKTTGVVDTIPLTIHIVGNDNGSGYYKLDQLFSLLCQLNTHYAPTEFYFAVKWPIRYINNTAYYIHNNQDGYAMMLSNKVPNTTNIFFVKDPAGACGYYSPGPDCIAIANMCAGTNSTTVTHELGHYFSLPHTFYGWEGGVTPSNPEKVTRGAGANCTTAGDGFCDTEADYISDRWQCPYTGTKLDQNGTAYHPDSSIYMSYSIDNCQSRFSVMEMAKMQNRYTQRASNLSMAGIPTYTVPDSAQIIYPTNLLYANEKRIIWNAVPGAQYYHVKITSLVSASLIYQEELTAGTQMNLTFLLVPGGSYAVHIAALNSRNVCRANTSVSSFTTTDATIALGINDKEPDNEVALSFSPNPVQHGRVLTVTANGSITGNVEIINMAGQTVASVPSKSASSNLAITIGDWPAGMYIVRYATSTGSVRRKLIVE